MAVLARSLGLAVVVLSGTVTPTAAPTGSGRGATAAVVADAPAGLRAGVVADAPAPPLRDPLDGGPIGGEAERFELEGPATVLSAWYRLSYITGSRRLRVLDHNPPTALGPQSDIGRSEDVAWHVARVVLGEAAGSARPGEVPPWARPRTGPTDGSSGGLVFALADLDLLTPGRLVGDLRVAATGTIGSDGAVAAVRGVDAKLAAARLSGPAVVFAPDFPDGEPAMAALPTGPPLPGESIGRWLDTAAYERAGQAAAAGGPAAGGPALGQRGSPALVRVGDVRQALAWLCGRTGGTTICSVAHEAAAMPVDQARPFAHPVPADRAGPC